MKFAMPWDGKYPSPSDLIVLAAGCMVVVAVMVSLASIAGCPKRPDTTRYGTVRVSVQDCRAPHTEWAEEAVPHLDRLGGPAWITVPRGERSDVTVRCVTFPEGSRLAGRLTLTGPEFDPTRTTSSMEVAAVVRHELVHWRIYHGPHPERATLHVCQHQWDDPSCWPREHGIALMNPAMLGGAPIVGMDEAYAGSLPHSEVMFQDADFFLWAIAR